VDSAGLYVVETLNQLVSRLARGWEAASRRDLGARNCKGDVGPCRPKRDKKNLYGVGGGGWHTQKKKKADCCRERLPTKSDKGEKIEIPVQQSG